MGRKIEMRKIENTTRRQITFSKRKSSLMRKSNEISVLCGVDIALLTYSPSGRLNKFCSRDRIEDVIKSYINLSPEKRYRHRDLEFILNNAKNLKTKLEKLQMLDFIGDDTNKLDYVNDRIKHLELQEKRSKATLETVEDKIKEYDISSCKEPSLDQLFECENNLKSALQMIMDRKSELVRELVHPDGQSKGDQAQVQMMGMESRSCAQQFEKKDTNYDIQNSNGSQLLMQPDPLNTTTSLKLSERSFQDIINNGSMRNELGGSKIRIRPSHNYNSNIFQDQDPVEGSMRELEAAMNSNSNSNFFLPPATNISTPHPMYELRAPAYTPSPMQGMFGHDASYGIQQRYPTPTLANHENNPNRHDDGTSTFQFNVNVGKANEFNLSNHYPSTNSNDVGVPSTSQRICDPFFVANLGNDNGCFDGATEEYECPDNSVDFIDTNFTNYKWPF